LKAATGKKHLDKLWNEMTTHFKLFVDAGDQEELHKFRVAAKRIRSFLTLIQNCNNDDRFLKNLEPVIKIFKQAGIIREAYLETQILEQYQLTAVDFSGEQHRLLTTNMIELRHYAKKDLKMFAQVSRYMSNHVSGIDNEDIIVFYHRQLYQIAHTLARRKFDEQLHTCRKKIKHLLYNYKTIGKKSIAKISLNIAYFDELQKLIGDWHDKLALLDLLSVRLVSGGDAQKLKTEINKLQQTILINCIGFWSKALTLNND
jgi:CHAD domain-containing protein